MVIDMRGDAFGMPGFDRRQQRLVRPRDLMRIVVQAADQPDHHAQLGREIIEQPQQAPVVGDFKDQPVKAIILFHLPRGIVEIGGLVQNIDLPPQHVARLRREISRGQHAGVPLDANAQIIDLVDVPDFELAHEEAAARASPPAAPASPAAAPPRAPAPG